LTYQQTYTRARTIAEGLLQLQHPQTHKKKTKLLLQKGDRVLLVFLPSLDFIVAFLGCLMAKVIPVPVFPPDPRKLKKDLYMFASIQVRFVVFVCVCKCMFVCRCRCMRV
jgi:acyl-CoA synthetase (AMP-forming)/AMP-acid ligase II